MAGLLDSDWVKFLAAPRQYYADKRIEQGAEEFKGLLGSLEQQGPPDPSQPQGGLLAPRAPDQQFWLKAAQIPAYQALAGQQLGYEAAGQQAMGRQTQQQNWSTQNMTQAEFMRQRLAEAEAQAKYQNMQAELGLNSQRTAASVASGYASANNSNASAGLTGLKAVEQRNKNSLLGERPVFDKLTAQQQVEGNEKMAIIDRATAGAMDVNDWARNRATAAALPGFAGTSEANAMKQEWQFGVKPVVMQMLNTGVLQPAEEEMVQGLIGKPDDYVLTESQLNSISNMMQKVKDRRVDLYKSYGKTAAEIPLGSSAAARTLSRGKPSGDLNDVTTRPGGDTQRSGLKPLLERPGGNQRYPGKIDRKS
jgi:hypothetical protein